ncbi:hypothetical protein HDU76_004319 [Blyttiomyces sp. JEL0837]|nr:hypothetical protein HDU76_004319 [Blyttiomyces sp. JEL0837]
MRCWCNYYNTVDINLDKKIAETFSQTVPLIRGQAMCLDNQTSSTVTLDANIACSINGNTGVRIIGTLNPPTISTAFAYLKANAVLGMSLDFKANAQAAYSQKYPIVEQFSIYNFGVPGILGAGVYAGLDAQLDASFSFDVTASASYTYNTPTIDAFWGYDTRSSNFTNELTQPFTVTDTPKQIQGPSFNANAELSGSIGVEITPRIFISVDLFPSLSDAPTFSNATLTGGSFHFEADISVGAKAALYAKGSAFGQVMTPLTSTIFDTGYMSIFSSSNTVPISRRGLSDTETFSPAFMGNKTRRAITSFFPIVLDQYMICLATVKCCEDLYFEIENDDTVNPAVRRSLSSQPISQTSESSYWVDGKRDHKSYENKDGDHNNNPQRRYLSEVEDIPIDDENDHNSNRTVEIFDRDFNDPVWGTSRKAVDVKAPIPASLVDGPFWRANKFQSIKKTANSESQTSYDVRKHLKSYLKKVRNFSWEQCNDYGLVGDEFPFNSQNDAITPGSGDIAIVDNSQMTNVFGSVSLVCAPHGESTKQGVMLKRFIGDYKTKARNWIIWTYQKTPTWAYSDVLKQCLQNIEDNSLSFDGAHIIESMGEHLVRSCKLD